MIRIIKMGMGIIMTVALLGNVAMSKAQAEDYDDSKILQGLEEGSYRLQASDYETPRATDSAYKGTLSFVPGTDHRQKKIRIIRAGKNYLIK